MSKTWSRYINQGKSTVLLLGAMVALSLPKDCNLSLTISNVTRGTDEAPPQDYPDLALFTGRSRKSHEFGGWGMVKSGLGATVAVLVVSIAVSGILHIALSQHDTALTVAQRACKAAGRRLPRPFSSTLLGRKGPQTRAKRLSSKNVAAVRNTGDAGPA
jgi:hypothetical protein